MLYTMRTGVDSQKKEKIAHSVLYGTGLLVAGFLAIAPFTGNNTFWMGGSNGPGTTSNESSDNTSSDKTYSNTANSSKDTKNTGTPATTSASGTGTPSTSSNTTSNNGGIPVSAAPSSTAGAATTAVPVVGRGGGTGTVSEPTKSPQQPALPVDTTPSSPVAPLPITVCTPTAGVDPLLIANPACVN